MELDSQRVSVTFQCHCARGGFGPRFSACEFSLLMINVIKMVFQPWKSPDSYFIDQIYLLTYYEWKT